MDAYKRYPEMTRAQARAYLTQFLDEMDASHARLVATSEASGGPSGSQLDFTIESLGPLWEWAKPRFSWRPGYALPPQGQPDPWRTQDLEPESELPSWFQHPSSVGMDRLDAESLWLCDGLGRYAARILHDRVPGVKWASGANRPVGNMYANKPVLTGFRVDHCPSVDATARATALLNPDVREPPSLLEHHALWAKNARAR